MTTRLLLLCLLLLSLLQVGCRDASQPLRLGTNVWPGYEPIYLARTLGYLDPEKVQLVELLSASEVIRAYRNGTLDMAALTLDEALLLAEDGSDVQILLATNTSFGADAVVVRDADSMQALRGRRIGVETTALGAYMLTRALEQSDMTMADVIPVNLEFNQHEEAFSRGDVDAVVTFEPVLSRLLEQGGQVVFDSRQLPSEVIDVIVVRPELVGPRQAALRHLVDAWYSSLDYMNRQPLDAAQLMSPRLRLSPEQTKASWYGLRLLSRDENLQLLYGREPFLLEQARRLNRVMVENDLMQSELDLSDLIVQPRLLP